MKKQPQVTELTRKKLINSFWNLYKEKDITKIRIKNICDCAKYDRTTFYRYYNDITDILNKLEDEIIISIANSISKNINDKNSNKINYDGFNIFNNKYGEYITIFYKNSNRNFYNKLKRIIKKDVYKYFNFSIDNADIEEFVFEFVFSSLINSYVYWYNHKNIMSLKSFVEFANNVISNGINIVLKNTHK